MRLPMLPRSMEALIMTIGELLGLYFTGHLDGKASCQHYVRIFRQVYPPLVLYQVDQVPFQVLLEWWKGQWDRPSHANKSIGLYRAAHRWAFGLGLLTTTDQTSGFEKRPEQQRIQTVSPEE